MNVHELIALLEKCPSDLEVVMLDPHDTDESPFLKWLPVGSVDPGHITRDHLSITAEQPTNCVVLEPGVWPKRSRKKAT